MSKAKSSTPAPEPTPVPAPTRPRVGSLVAFTTRDEVTGRRRNGHAIVREHLADGRTVLVALPDDTLVVDDAQIAKA